MTDSNELLSEFAERIGLQPADVLYIRQLVFGYSRQAVAAERARCFAIANHQAKLSRDRAEYGFPNEAHLVAEMIAEQIEGK